jgi:signal transduction histidine kinase
MGERAEEKPVRLPPLDLERATALLAVPEIPEHAVPDVRLARSAAGSMVPLLLVASPTARPLLTVRALHALAHRPGVVWLCPSPGLADERVSDGATVIFLVEAASPAALAVVEAHLDEPRAWIVVVCEDPTRLPATLVMRAGAATLRLSPVSERADDLRHLAPAVLQALSGRAGHPPAALAPDALAALRAHQWAGGRIELERVLARALLLAGPGGTIDAALLDLTPDVPPAVQPTPRVPEAPGLRLEYLLAELAHELRNPLVTVKTFAQQLPALLDDPALRMRFAELTDEAVERMDTLLENVLAFARLDSPRPEDLDVGAVLDGVLRDVSPALDQRALRVRLVGGGAQCAADRVHLRYALSNLLLGIAHETPPKSELVVDASVNGLVTLRFGTGAAVTRLRDLTAPVPGATLDDPTFLPLAFTLARAVLERTGGRLGVMPDLGGQATVTVRLPPVASAVAERGGGTT